MWQARRDGLIGQDDRNLFLESHLRSSRTVVYRVYFTFRGIGVAPE
jgi:hypothetical protein